MATQYVITDFEILRNVMPSGLVAVDCPRGAPLRVMTLLDEEDFLKYRAPIHHRNVFMEDHVHDWNFAGGKLRYYSRVRTHSDKGNDVLLIYAVEEREVPMKFCPQTGKPLGNNV